MIVFWDKACYWTERVGDWLSTPWFRLSRYCYARWRAADSYWRCPRCGEANGARRSCYACGWPYD